MPSFLVGDRWASHVLSSCLLLGHYFARILHRAGRGASVELCVAADWGRVELGGCWLRSSGLGLEGGENRSKPSSLVAVDFGEVDGLELVVK